MIPLHLISGITVELTLGDAGQAFDTTHAPNWDVSDCSMLASCIAVNSTISAQYQNHLAQGLEMPISFTSVVGTRHVVTNQSFTLSLARSLTHLKQLFFVIVSTAQGKVEVKDFEINCVGSTGADGAEGERISLARDAFTWQVQLGSRRYPDFPVVGVAESYYRLTQSAGIAGNLEDISLTPQAYVNGTGAVFGINFEKLGDQAAFSGVNSQGQVMTLTASNAWPSTDATPRHVFCYQVFDSILNIRGLAGGVDIVD